MEQTPVEWLAEEYAKYIAEPWKYVQKGGKKAIIEQAKEMEFEQRKKDILHFLEVNNWMSLEDEKNAKSVVEVYLKTYQK